MNREPLRMKSRAVGMSTAIADEIGTHSPAIAVHVDTARMPIEGTRSIGPNRAELRARWRKARKSKGRK